MKLVLLAAFTKREEWQELALANYVEKIQPLFPFAIIQVKSRKSARARRATKQMEDSAALLQQVTKQDWVVLCDEKGQSWGSVQLAGKLQSWWNNSSYKRIVFIVGGPYGVTDEVRNRANWIWSLSPLTFNHCLAQVVVTEQLYRALTIIRGLPYHNE